jgi:hypothetical protein
VFIILTFVFLFSSKYIQYNTIIMCYDGCDDVGSFFLGFGF